MKIERIELPEPLTEKTACEFVGRLASVCTGKEPATDAIAEEIGRKNLTEHLGKPTRCWEFLPLYSEAYYNNFRGAINNDKEYYTLEKMCKDYNTQHWTRSNYHLFKLSVPKYVRDHVKTHTKLSSISSSARIGIDKKKLYEFPKIEKFNIASKIFNKLTNKPIILNFIPPFFFSKLLKYSYNRKEITKRSLSDFELVYMAIGGYFSEGWDNFIKVRTASCDGTFICPNPKCDKPCIQKETRWVAEQIREAIK